MDKYKKSQDLTDNEEIFLRRQIDKEKFYFYFCLLDIVIAISMLIYMLFQGLFDTTRFILSIILLLNARMNLKQYKNIQLLKKLSS